MTIDPADLAEAKRLAEEAAKERPGKPRSDHRAREYADPAAEASEP